MEMPMGEVWARRGLFVGRWVNRFAPVLAPLRCARPVFDARSSTIAEAPGLSQPPKLERHSIVSADFGTGGPVAGGERRSQTQGTGDRGAGRLCRDALGLSAVWAAHGDSRL